MEQVPQKPCGRPSEYTPEIGEAISDEISFTKDSIATIAKKMGLRPSTLYGWMQKNPDFAALYTRARETRGHTVAEETLEIADDDSIDHNHKRIMVETRKWLAAKLLPKVYGEKTTIDTNVTLTLAQLVEQSYKVVENVGNKVVEAGNGGRMCTQLMK